MDPRERGILVAAAILMAGIGLVATVGLIVLVPAVGPPEGRIPSPLPPQALPSPSTQVPPPPPPPPASLSPAYWQGASEEGATHRLVVRVTRADKVAPVTFDLLLRLHDPADPSWNSEPSSCLSADSFEPRAYFNGCVFLESTSVEKGTLSLDLSWGGDGGRVGCKESVGVPLDRSFRTSLHCGARLETELQRRPRSAGGATK